MTNDILQFRSRADSGEFLVPVGELGGFRLGEIPPHSTVELIDLPESPAGYHLGIRSTNCEDAGIYRSLGISITVSIAGTTNIDRRLARIRRAFKPEVDSGAIQQPQELRFDLNDQHVSCMGYAQNFSNQPETVFAEAVSPVLRAFARLLTPDVHLFVCHASEDKEAALAFADFLRERGTDVWFDQWEIRVGDSIVQKIDDALSKATHLAVLLSSVSVSKPWVRRELSSTLMRQLTDNSISVLPLVLDDCAVPAILADIRFADCRGSRESGFTEALRALS
jgi:hypothetical protein